MLVEPTPSTLTLVSPTPRPIREEPGVRGRRLDLLPGFPDLGRMTVMMLNELNNRMFLMGTML